MTFEEALKILDISDFEERILNSHSKGELLHIPTYIVLAEALKSDASGFRELFVEIVEYAEQNWDRPDSVFQHIDKFLFQQ